MNASAPYEIGRRGLVLVLGLCEREIRNPLHDDIAVHRRRLLLGRSLQCRQGDLVRHTHVALGCLEDRFDGRLVEHAP